MKRIKKQEKVYDTSTFDGMKEFAKDVAAALGLHVDTGDRIMLTDNHPLAPLIIRLSHRKGARCYVEGFGYTLDKGEKLRLDCSLPFETGHKCRRHVAQTKAWGCKLEKNPNIHKVTATLLDHIPRAMGVRGNELRDARRKEREFEVKLSEAKGFMTTLFGFDERKQDYYDLPFNIPGFFVQADVKPDKQNHPRVHFRISCDVDDVGEVLGGVLSIPSVKKP